MSSDAALLPIVRECTSFNADLSEWNTENVITMESMFRHATSFNGDIGMWNTRKVENMSAMFFGAPSFRSDISAWDVRSTVDLSMAFVGTTNFEVNLCAWGQRLPSSVRVLTRSMFIGSSCPNTDDPDPRNLEQGPFCFPCVETSSLLPLYSGSFTETSKVFDDIADLYAAVDQYFDDNSPTSYIANLYGYPISVWNVSGITSFESVFDVERNPSATYFNEPLDGWDTRSATTMRRMFAGAYMFNSILEFNTSSVTDMSGMCKLSGRLCDFGYNI